jgi:hypothetical protein
MTPDQSTLWKVASLMLIAGWVYFGFATLLDGTLFRPPLVHWAGSFAVVSKQPLKPGDNLELRVVVTKYRDLPGEINWTLVCLDDRQTFRFAPRNSMIDLGYHDLTAVVLTLPTYIKAGWYEARGYVEYEVNPFAKLRLKVQSEPFLVKGDGC